MSALYLALTLDGMFAKIGHGFARRFDPLTICTYRVDMADVVDLHDAPTLAAKGLVWRI